ncbi:MAG: glycosyltransferase family 2 protein [Thermoanaerobaculia bacterium]
MATLVTVGVPVYNAAAYLRESLDSIRAQTYENLEIIISDNASTDATEEISREAASVDRRIRYVRQPRNIGGGPNFAYVLDQARGEYFLWQAHDDVRAPRAIESMVEALRTDAGAVSAVSDVRTMDAAGRDTGPSPFRAQLLDTPDVVRRLVALAEVSHNMAFYGLVRTAVARSIPPLTDFINEDVRFTFELAMRGRFAAVNAELFFCRMINSDADYARQYVERSGGDYALGRWRLFATAIARGPLTAREKKAALEAVRAAIAPQMFRRAEHLLWSTPLSAARLMRWARQFPPLLRRRSWWVAWRRLLSGSNSIGGSG